MQHRTKTCNDTDYVTDPAPLEAYLPRVKFTAVHGCRETTDAGRIVGWIGFRTKTQLRISAVPS